MQAARDRQKSYADLKHKAMEFLTVPLEGLHVDDKLRFVEEPVEIMDREVKRLKQSRIPIVKVRWNSRRGPEFTWEREGQFQKKSSTNANTANNQRGTEASQKATCYECRNQGHYKNDCPERKNQNHENQTGGIGAHGMVHAFGGGETEQDLNNIKDEIDA
ncbi:putative reverse transcriptase domain-containing protein [Tanacetum coccineum]